MEHLLQQQVKQCETLLEKSPLDKMLVKAVGAARSALAKLKSENGSDDGIKTAMQSYTQSVLDSTYYEECQLVEQEFPVSIASETIIHLITSLASPTLACGSPERVATLLGTELLECVYWRVGSLMYMYCHTLMEEEGRRNDVDDCLIEQYCSVGIGHLELMLSSRSPLNPDDDYICNDTGIMELLQKGIFSDVHMLAMMYAGELCYWAWSINTATSKKQVAEELGAASSESNTKTVNITSSATAKSSPPSSNLPREEQNNKTAESADSSEGTVTVEPPSLVVVQLPTPGVTTSGGTELSKTGNKDDANAERSCRAHNVDPSSSDSSTSRTSLEKTVQDLSIQDHTELVASGCSNSTAGGIVPAAAAPERQLYSVMEHSQGAEAVTNWKSRFNPLKRGQELLSKFVEVARGPLKAQGWNYARAVQLLVAMKKAQQYITQ